MGSGYAEHQAALAAVAEAAEPGRASLTLAFDEALAHRLYGAADLFLMPSRQEPCGLGQLYAMRYGAPPVVHAVGGLCDTVTPWDGAQGTGFRFETYTPEAFVGAALDALAALAGGGESVARQRDAARLVVGRLRPGISSALYRAVGLGGG